MDNQIDLRFEEVLNIAEQGDADAQNELGVIYMSGKGIEPNLAKAVHWFLLSGNKGNPLAFANLGRCYAEGLGVEKNLTHAVTFFAAANLMGIDDVESYVLNEISINELIGLAQQGNADAQYFLGLSYAIGTQVVKNINCALNWFHKATEQNNPLALIAYSRCLANEVGLDQDLLKAEYILKQASKYAEKRVGILGVQKVNKEINLLRDRIPNEVPYVLAKIIPVCVEDGIPKDKYVQDFLDGKLFVQTLDQFGDLEKRQSSSDNDFRGDVLEGYSESFGKGYNPHLYKSDQDGNIAKDGMIGMIDVLKLRAKVLCLTSLEYIGKDKIFLKPDPQIKDFGDYAIIIKDVDEFLNRVKDAFESICERDNIKYWMSYKRVKYNIDLSQQFQYNEFHKSKSYEWQKEFRIVFDFSVGKFSEEILKNVTDSAKIAFQGKILIDSNPLSISDRLYFEVGDIRDICEFVTTDSLIDENGLQLDLVKSPEIVLPFEMERLPRPTFCKGVIPIPRGDGTFNLGISTKSFFSATV